MTYGLIKNIANRYANEIRTFPNEKSRYHVDQGQLLLTCLV